MTISRFWREIDQRYNLKGSTCGNCKGTFFPARTMCPKCRHLSLGKLEPFTFSGNGRIESYTTVHAPPPGFELQSPYVVALVRLDEGPVVTGQIVDARDGIAVGARVRKVFRRVAQDGEAGVIHYGFKFKIAP